VSPRVFSLAVAFGVAVFLNGVGLFLGLAVGFLQSLWLFGFRLGLWLSLCGCSCTWLGLVGGLDRLVY